jgi:alkaline phosphatase D
MIYDDFDAALPRPVAVEFSVTGISSTPVFRSFASVAKQDSPLRPLVAVDGERFGKPGDILPALNVTLRYGTRAAMTAAQTGDLKAAMAARNPKQNTHLRYVDTDSNGYGLLRVSANGVVSELVTVAPAKKDYGADGAPVRRIARFHVTPWAKGQGPVMNEPLVEGEKPFPLV